MFTEIKSPNRFNDTPREKPQGERVEHANIERPGAQAHPRATVARDWSHYVNRGSQWRMH